MNPCKFYKCLSDDTRLKVLLLIAEVGEACVCHFVDALKFDQPKVSRHLSELRKCEILKDDRRGKWVYYSLHPSLEQWAINVIRDTAKNNTDYFSNELSLIQSSLNNGCL